MTSASQILESFRNIWSQVSSKQFEVNCAYLILASLNSLYNPLSVLHVVEISAAALNRSFTVPAKAVNAERSLSVP